MATAFGEAVIREGIKEAERFWDHPLDYTAEIVTGVGGVLYDAVEGPAYYASGGLMGDRRSLDRNTASLRGFMDGTKKNTYQIAQKMDQDDPQGAGALAGLWFGGTILSARRGRAVQGHGVQGVPDTKFLEQPTQTGMLTYVPPRSPDIGSETTIRQLLETGEFPGASGTVLRGDYTHADLYELSTLGGRQVEFGIGTRVGANGEAQTIIVNGGYVNGKPVISFPKDVYPTAHTHPIPDGSQYYPSNADLRIMQERVSILRSETPGAKIEPHHIIYSADEVPTAFSPLPFDYFK